jgi:plasmid maintenance system antidote protein VapI
LKRGKLLQIQLFDLHDFLGMSSEFWIGLQSQYELDVAADALGERLEKEVRIYSKVA